MENNKNNWNYFFLFPLQSTLTKDFFLRNLYFANLDHSLIESLAKRSLLPKYCNMLLIMILVIKVKKKNFTFVKEYCFNFKILVCTLMKLGYLLIVMLEKVRKGSQSYNLVVKEKKKLLIFNQNWSNPLLMNMGLFTLLYTIIIFDSIFFQFFWKRKFQFLRKPWWHDNNFQLNLSNLIELKNKITWFRFFTADLDLFVPFFTQLWLKTPIFL